MRAGGVLGRDQEKEEMRRLPVERLEIDPGGTAPEGGDDATETGQLPVRDGDPFAERGAVQTFAVLYRRKDGNYVLIEPESR